MSSDLSVSKYLDSVIYGGTRSLCVNTLLYPLDVIKTHQQSHRNKEHSYQVCKRLWTHHGPLSFFDGLSSQLFKSTLRQIWTWPLVMGIPYQLTAYQAPQPAKFVFTAICIATVDAGITTPLEKRRVLAITHAKKTSLKELVSQGKKGWSGFDAHWLKLVVRWSAFLNAQDYFRDRIRRQYKLEKLSYPHLIQAGVQTAAVISLAIAPFDVSNTLRQSTGLSFWQQFANDRQGLLSNAASAVRKGFRGWPMTATSMIVHNVASVILMEKLGMKFKTPLK